MSDDIRARLAAVTALAKAGDLKPLRTEYAWACEPPCGVSRPCLHWPVEGDREQWVRARAAQFGVVYVREVTDWRPETTQEARDA